MPTSKLFRNINNPNVLMTDFDTFNIMCTARHIPTVVRPRDYGWVDVFVGGSCLHFDEDGRLQKVFASKPHTQKSGPGTKQSRL